MSSCGLYLLGFGALIVGLGMIAYLLGVPAIWVTAGSAVLILIGVLAGLARLRRPDPPGT
ncbi:MAG: hypothetical protein FIB01_09365 [Gemmatimonadetes bacterium]|nr:hypothetical protein [Gemmatimonadota bacterium]